MRSAFTTKDGKVLLHAVPVPPVLAAVPYRLPAMNGGRPRTTALRALALPAVCPHVPSTGVTFRCTLQSGVVHDQG